MKLAHWTTNFFKTGLAVLFGSALLLANTGYATPFTNVGDTITVNYDGNIGRTGVAGLTAQTTFTLTGIAGNTLNFDITIANTSDINLWSSTRIAAIGFDADPNISNASVTSPSGWGAVLNGSFPNNFGNVEICFKTGQLNNCQGGGGGGISLGDSAITLNVALTFTGSPPPVIFDNFGVRYQSLTSKVKIDGKNYNDASGTGNGTPDIIQPPSEIPEPASMLLFGAGLLGLGLSRRRKLA